MQRFNDVPKDTGDLQRDIKALRNYVIELKDFLNYKLSNLEVSNFTEQAKEEITMPSGPPQPVTPSLSAPVIQGKIDSAIEKATDLITGNTGGYVLIDYNEEGKPEQILVMDTEDKTTAQKVWRWNTGGFGYSSNGIDGPYELALTNDGAINADMITAGKITAMDIEGSTITGGYIVGTSIQGSEYIQYPEGTINVISVEGTASMDRPAKKFIFVSPTVLSDFAVGDSVVVGTSKGTTNYNPYAKIEGFYTSANTITSTPTEVAKLTTRYFFVNDTDVKSSWMTKLDPNAVGSALELYNVPVEDHEDLSIYETNKLGGIGFDSSRVVMYSKNGYSVGITSQGDVLINAVGSITLNGDRISMVAPNGFYINGQRITIA